jgi:hypothetical protein
MSQKLVIPNDIFFSEVERHLSEGKSVVFPVKGYSMLPFIRNGEDSVELIRSENPEVGDVALARLPNGAYVLHRVWDINGDKVTLMGDGNISGKEYCTKGDILGVAVKIIGSGGQVTECTDESYLRKVKIWRRLLPIRRYILAIYRRLI